ncbi:MAG: lysoplasmalogenase family protein, partial [Chitinophagaceae bacterium]
MKKFLKSYGIAVYWVILLADLFFIYFKIDEPRWITKLLLMPFLAYLLVINTTKSHLNSRDKYFYAALFFAWIGDLCLLLPNSHAFLGG